MKAKQKWRLLRDGIKDPFMHFAIEEALLRLTDENYTLPTLRLRQTEPSVWIGYYQQPQEDVDIAYCQQKQLKIVRRLNSGGAVYQDEGTFCYSAFFNKSDFFATYQINSSDELYPLFGRVITDLCSSYNIQATFSPVNDITVNGKKIYGSAQLDWYSAFVHSGSILVNVDKEVMQQALKPSNLKFVDKGFKTVRERVVNLSELSAKAQGINQIQTDFVKSFAKALKVEFVEQPLTSKEMQLAEKLYREKYSKPEWTFSAAKHYSTVVSTKISSGVLLLKCELLQNKIQSASLSGDFLIPNHRLVENLLSNLGEKTLSQAMEIVQDSNLPNDLVLGLTQLLNQLKSGI